MTPTSCLPSLHVCMDTQNKHTQQCKFKIFLKRKMSSLRISKILLMSVCKYHNEAHHYQDQYMLRTFLNILKSLQAITYFQASCLLQLQKITTIRNLCFSYFPQRLWTMEHEPDQSFGTESSVWYPNIPPKRNRVQLLIKGLLA